MSPGRSESEVEELQGLYGPFAFSELLLQKLWWRSEFSVDGARTADGRALQVRYPGRWNRLGGPDFRDAILELNGERLRGDVEVHLRAADWQHHGHSNDPAYGRVVLHVVLFPPREPFTAGRDGLIPILPLLPLLWHDLEEYAADEAIAALLNRAEHRLAAELAVLPPGELETVLREQGHRRWLEKVRYAARRIERLGWEDACHQTALEILGYRLNRAGMLRAAAEWPLAAWRSGRIDPEQVFQALRPAWALQGVRPANHPRERLRQYGAWVRQLPYWPQRLAGWARLVGSAAGDAAAQPTATARRALHFPSAWSTLLQAICGGIVAPPRGDNLVADGFLPLLAAREEMDPAVAFAWWWHGYPGDLPEAVRRALRELGMGGGRGAPPAAIGPAQGLLGWLLERDSRRCGAPSAAVRQGA